MVTQRLARSSTDKVLAGVCGGLAQYFGIDVVFVRLIMVGLVLAGGLGILLYPLLWLIMPVEGATPQSLRVGLQEMQREAQSFGQQVASQWSARQGSGTPRYDPQTGQPLPEVQADRRNRALGLLLLIGGALMLSSYFGATEIVMALLILGGGIYLLRRPTT